MQRSLCLALTASATALIIAHSPAPAYGQTCSAASVRKIKQLNIDAMDEADRWELEKAKQKLDDAQLVAKSRGCLQNETLAVSHVILGVVQYRLRNISKMEEAWMTAFSIDPGVTIPKRVASAKIQRLFIRVRAKHSRIARPRPRPRPDVAVPVPQGPPKGFEHMPAIQWEEGKTMMLRVRAPESMAIEKINLFYDSAAAPRGRKIPFTKAKDDKWTWVASVPGSQVRGKQLRYYLVAYGPGGREVAASGNSANMHIVGLTPAVVTPRRVASTRAGAADGGIENPLTGGVIKRRVTVVRRRVEPEYPLEQPESGQAERPAAGVTRRHVPARGVEPNLFAALGLGTGIGIMRGRTEITDELVDDTPSMGSLYGQLEVGYLITQNWMVAALVRFGGLFISDEVKDPKDIPDVSAKGNDKDVLVLARVRYRSDRLLRLDMPVNLRWYAGLGLGWGIIRHLANANHPTLDKKVLDTDRSAGFVPNVFGGASLCVVRSCAINVFLELNYLAAFSSNSDLNTFFHGDVSLGANFAF